MKVNGTKVDLDVNDTYEMSSVETDTTVTVEGVADITRPTASITVGTHTWRDFINQLSFGLFFKERQTVTISAQDDGSGLNGIHYYLAKEEIAFEDIKKIADWEEYNGIFHLNPDNKYVIYVKIVDNAQNVCYINTSGLILDGTAPVITGVEN